MNPHPYSAYQPSDIPWLGDVPEHWDVRRLRTVVDMRVSNVDKHTKDDEFPVRLCNYVDVYKNDRITPAIPFMTATASRDEIERFRLESGDVLITKDSETWDDIGVPALVVESADDLLSGYHLSLLRPTTEILGSYLSRTLQSKGVAYQFHVRANGITRYGLTQTAIKSVCIPLPPLPEQRAIAKYLDYMDRRIQRYVRAKERLIGLLEEQKRAVINQAVTRGLDSDVPLKSSGVEWLGDVPAHWEVVKTSRIFKIGSGTTPPTDQSHYYGGGIPWVTTSELRETVVTSTKKTVTQTALNNFPALRIFPRHSVVAAMYGATIGRVGYLGTPATVNQACCVFTAGKAVEPWYWFYWLQARRPHLIALSYGGGQPNLSQELLKSIRVPLPTLEEQRAIVEHLDAVTSHIEAHLETVNRQIELIKEYRTRLIADVVTGKLDVRAAAADLPDE